MDYRSLKMMVDEIQQSADKLKKHFLEKAKEETGDKTYHPNRVPSYTAKWLEKQIGNEVELYMDRAPKVIGKIIDVDSRFGRMLVENDHEIIEVKLMGVSQIRYPKRFEK